MNTYTANETNVKALGRTYFYDQVLWFSHSASGAEFILQGSYCEITFMGDETATASWGAGHEARIAVYLDDRKVIDSLIDAETKSFSINQGELRGGIVRIVKLSEASDSTVGILKIMTDGTIAPPSDHNALKLEFIGDSITCGYGVDEELGGLYSTANEDATKSYAYKAARKLQADYSMVCFSGYGIISGYTGDGKLNADSLLPPYYDRLGRSYGSFASGRRPEHIQWDFKRYTPDLIIINLGTNDSSYCKEDSAKGEAFRDAYVEFLKTVREKNPDSYILCTLGIMGTYLYPYVEQAVLRYREETMDRLISSMQLTEQRLEDGYAVDWHPSEITHEKASTQLVKYLNEIRITKE